MRATHDVEKWKRRRPPAFAPVILLAAVNIFQFLWLRPFAAGHFVRDADYRLRHLISRIGGQCLVSFLERFSIPARDEISQSQVCEQTWLFRLKGHSMLRGSDTLLRPSKVQALEHIFSRDICVFFLKRKGTSKGIACLFRLTETLISLSHHPKGRPVLGVDGDHGLEKFDSAR